MTVKVLREFLANCPDEGIVLVDINTGTGGGLRHEKDYKELHIGYVRVDLRPEDFGMIKS